MSVEYVQSTPSISSSGIRLPTNHEGLYRAVGVWEKKENNMRRLVEVFVFDADKNVPVEKALLYESGRFWTDESDQEIKLSLPLTELVGKHNSMRVDLIDEIHERNTGLVRNLKPLKLSEVVVRINAIVTAG